MRKLCIALVAALAAPSLALAQGTAYGYDHRGVDILFSFNPDDPLDQVLINFPLDYATYGLDFSADAETLYAINHLTADDDGDGNPDTLEFGTIDPDIGTWSLIKVLDMPAPNETGLSVDPSDDTIYLSTSTTLYTVDADTGDTTVVGPFTGQTDTGADIGIVIDIAVDNCGQMYAHDITNDGLWSVDKTTGEATWIGSHGLAANFAQGMDFDPTTNVLYVAVYTGGGTGRYGTFDLTTGEVTEILDGILFTDPEGGDVELEMAIRGVGECDESCFADCDGSGELNILDFVCYQGLFQSGDPGADCDGNGLLNILDFVCFQGAFQAGCP